MDESNESSRAVVGRDQPVGFGIGAESVGDASQGAEEAPIVRHEAGEPGAQPQDGSRAPAGSGDREVGDDGVPFEPLTPPASSDVEQIAQGSDASTSEIATVPSAGREGEGDSEEDDLAWTAMSARPAGRGLSWEPDYEEAASWRGVDETRVGALGRDQSDHEPLFSFEDEDELDERPLAEPEPQHGGPQVGQAGARSMRAAGHKASGTGGAVGVAARAGRNVGTAVFTGVAAAVVLLGALALFSNLGGVVIAIAALTVAAVELFSALRVRGLRPATLLGVVATAALSWAAYARGEQAIALVTTLVVTFCLLWYLLGAVETRHLALNAAASLLGFAYVGVLGSYAALLLRWPPAHAHGVGLLLGALIAGVAYDLGGFVVGRRFGRTPLAPHVSPNKTWEGLVGGIGLSVLTCLLLVSHISPWSLTRAFALGVVVSVVAPLGDLCESMLKRDLRVKDMGSVLPGHGGVLDRIDALLFVMPATYYLARLLNIT